MEKELKSVTWDKYLDTDIDTVTLFFDTNYNHNIVDEFDVPEEEMHMVFISENKKTGDISWVMVVNPDDVYERENATLPNVKIAIKGSQYSLKEMVNMLVTTK